MIMIEIIAMTLQQSKHGRVQVSLGYIKFLKLLFMFGEENIVSDSRLNLGIILIMLLSAFREHNNRFYFYHLL